MEVKIDGLTSLMDNHLIHHWAVELLMAASILGIVVYWIKVKLINGKVVKDEA